METCVGPQRGLGVCSVERVRVPFIPDRVGMDTDVVNPYSVLVGTPVPGERDWVWRSLLVFRRVHGGSETPRQVTGRPSVNTSVSEDLSSLSTSVGEQRSHPGLRRSVESVRRCETEETTRTLPGPRWSHVFLESELDGIGVIGDFKEETIFPL